MQNWRCVWCAIFQCDQYVDSTCHLPINKQKVFFTCVLTDVLLDFYGIWRYFTFCTPQINSKLFARFAQVLLMPLVCFWIFYHISSIYHILLYILLWINFTIVHFSFLFALLRFITNCLPGLPKFFCWRLFVFEYFIIFLQFIISWYTFY